MREVRSGRTTVEFTLSLGFLMRFFFGLGRRLYEGRLVLGEDHVVVCGHPAEALLLFVFKRDPSLFLTEIQK